jgi:hypothetical protein
MIIRVEHRENPYTLIRKASIEDRRLSFKARGILAYLIGKPNHWKVRTQDLINQGTDGETSIQSGLKELYKYGYMVKKLLRGPDGKLNGTEVVVYETPQNDEEGDRDAGDIFDEPTPPTKEAKTATNAHNHREGCFTSPGLPPARFTGPLVSNELLASNEVRVAPPSGADRPPPKEPSGTEEAAKRVVVSDANGFAFPEEKETTRPPSPTRKAAEELHRQLAIRRKVMRPPNLEKWAEAFRRLLLDSDVGITRFERVLYWYVEHIDEDEFMPAAYSAQTFCDKFLTIERQMELRGGGTVDDTPTAVAAGTIRHVSQEE